MFRITEDPSSGSLVQCLGKNCKNGSIGWVTWYPVTTWNSVKQCLPVQ